jgi:hypothetical protein
MFSLDISHINTEEFRPEAIKFLDNERKYGQGRGFYIDPKLKGTKEWKDYWKLQEFYCTNGFSIGGVKITGEHYFYLNFCQISLKLVKKITGVKELNTKKTRVETAVTFPDFWDSDWYYFTECKKAEELGLHMIVLKPRRRGYSYKNAAKCAHTYTFSKTQSNSLILAEDKKYSEETMRMAVSYLDFLNRYTGFARQRQHINKPRELVQASYEEITPDGRKLIGGSMSRIMQYSTLNNPDVARGKDARVILFEEAGSMSNLKAAYTVTRPTVESGTAVSGQIYVYGTGGDFSGGMVDFEEMFYDPHTYGFLAYDNMYDEGSTQQIGYFLPDSYSKYGFITEQGISLHKEAETAILAEREHLRRTTKDINIVDKMICENPLKPSEAMLKMGTNIYPKAELNRQISYIKSNSHISNLGIHGYMERTPDGTVRFTPSSDSKPIFHFPYKPDVDGTGCVTIYQNPFKFGNQTPKDLYFICVDPYAMDKGKSKEITKRDSLGAAYVIKRINPFSKPYDIIVAEYVARPEFQEDFNKTIFLLAEHYNAKIVFENDRDGNIISYAKTNRLLHFLEEELTVYDNNDLPKKKLGRSYGVSMSNLEVKKQAVQYLRDWLLAAREVTEDGEKVLNLHKIYSIPLLEEVIKFSYDGNFDRHSALLVGMLYKKELLMKPPPEMETKNQYNDEFFVQLRQKLGIDQILQ